MGLMRCIRNYFKKREMLSRNRINIAPSIKKNIKLKIEGEGNEISIDTKKLPKKSKIRILIYGDKNKVIF